MAESASSSGVRPHVVIVGAGFGGLACARALGGAAADVTVIDRRNYHLFEPLLYQVATAALSPADIAQPIRRMLRHHRNIEVLLGEITGVDHAGRAVLLADGRRIGYERLVLATGSSYAYFGHDEWAAAAPGPKSIEDARTIRARLLLAFERAEASRDPAEQAALLTTVVVGGGPTGVEMAGSIVELARHALASDFRHIDPRRATTILVEAGPRILAAFPEELAAYAQRALEKLGVTVMTGTAVEDIRPGQATIGGKVVKAGTIVWGAGIKASPVAAWLGLPADRIGRVAVGPDLAVAGRAGVYLIGDAAASAGPDGRPLPALAQVADQQGRQLGRNLRAEIKDGRPFRPFRFRNRGNTAIVGRHAAVFDFGRLRLRGRIGWLMWGIVHVYLLNGFDKRLLVTLQWFWSWLTYRRGARLITGSEERERG